MNLDFPILFRRLKTITQYGFGQSIVIITQLVLSLIIIKKHSDALWGSYVELLLWVNIPALITHFGNKNYLLKAFSDQPSKLYQTWLTSLLSRGLLFAFIILAVLWVPLFQEHLTLIVLWIFLLFYNQSFESLIIYLHHFKISIYTELARNGLVILFLFLLINQLDLRLLLILVTSGAALKAICYSIFYFPKIKAPKFKIDLSFLSIMFPFFIPMFLGTIRTKTDAYYGTIFFSKEDLSHYQIFISLITLVQLGATYAINPYLKNIYRAKQQIVVKIEKQSALLGGLVAIIFMPMVYIMIHYIYDFHFSSWSYVFAFLFIITIFIHLILISDFYKNNKQITIAKITAVVALLQIVLGYFLIQNYHIEGALATKVIGQWAIVLTLIFLRKKIIS